MNRSVTSPVDIVAWEETPYDYPAGGPQLARVTVRKLFEGELEGESSPELLMCQADPDHFGAGAGYVASEQFKGRVDQRRGSFVIQHGGLSDGQEDERTFGHVVPGSGRGDLTGLRGEVEISQTPEGHVLTLTYFFKEMQ